MSTCIQTISLLVILTCTVTFSELWAALNFFITKATVNCRICTELLSVVVALLSFVNLYRIRTLHLIQNFKRQHCNLKIRKTSEKLLKVRFFLRNKQLFDGFESPVLV